jgi:hypothetical protein
VSCSLRAERSTSLGWPRCCWKPSGPTKLSPLANSQMLGELTVDEVLGGVVERIVRGLRPRAASHGA